MRVGADGLELQIAAQGDPERFYPLRRDHIRYLYANLKFFAEGALE